MVTLSTLLETHSIWLIFSVIAAVGIILISALRLFLRPAIGGALDPLNIQLLIFIGPALIGFVLLPFVTGAFSSSYYTILLFLMVWLIVIRCAGAVRKIDLSDSMPADFQLTILWMAIAIVILNAILNMIIPGKIPLFTEGGVYTRFDATTNNRLLSWMNLGTAPMPGIIFAITQRARVRRFALIALGIGIVESLLSASKGAILAIVLVLLNAMFVAAKRNQVTHYRKLRRYMIMAAICVACLTPVYLIAIGFGKDGGAAVALGTRFLAGFDQLMFTSQLDLLRSVNLGSALHVNLLEYQLMPFLKALFGSHYEYSSVGQYVVSAMTGNYVGAAATLPNSNLILEALFTSGTSLGLLMFSLELFVFYRLRRFAMSRPVTPLMLLLVCNIVINPFGLFLSGQEWITTTSVVLATILTAYGLTALWRVVARLLVFPRAVTTS